MRPTVIEMSDQASKGNGFLQSGLNTGGTNDLANEQSSSNPEVQASEGNGFLQSDQNNGGTNDLRNEESSSNPEVSLTNFFGQR